MWSKSKQQSLNWLCLKGRDGGMKLQIVSVIQSNMLKLA